MTTENNFAGREGHVTFVGVVEGRDDPAKMGRLRIRIIGLHTDDTNLVPTEDLPWAQIVAPINGSRSFSLPKDGEWVHGFFQDGYNSQMPVVTGIYVGMQSEEPKVDDGSVAKIEQLQKELATETATLNGMLAGSASNAEQKKINQQKIIDDLQTKYNNAIVKANNLRKRADIQLLPSLIRDASVAEAEAAAILVKLEAAKKAIGLITVVTPSQIEKQKAKIAAIQKQIDDLKTVVDTKSQRGFRDRRSQREVAASPNPPSGVVTERYNEPVLPALSRGVITKTGIEVSNANREHVCDFAMYVRNTMSAAKVGTGQIAMAIRKTIQAVIKALGTSGGSSAIAAQIRSFARLLKRAVAMLEEINAYVDVIVVYVKKINALIQYILSLPEKLLAMFKECLAQAYAELQEGIRLIVADFTGGGTSTISEISDAVKEVTTATKELATQAAKLYAAPATIVGAALNPTTPLSDAEAKNLLTQLFPNSQEYDSKSYGNGALV